MKKILVTGIYDLVRSPLYANPIEACGAEPIMLYKYTSTPPECDGLVLCGGVDINPLQYSEQNIASHNINNSLDDIELSLFNHYFSKSKPIMGICRGLQIINVALGGTLIQNLNTNVVHTSIDLNHETTHTVNYINNSLLGNVYPYITYNNTICVNSYHHQAIDKLGLGLNVTGICKSDGIIEAIEHDIKPVFGFQWHPERCCLTSKQVETNDGLMLFKKFLDID